MMKAAVLVLVSVMAAWAQQADDIADMVEVTMVDIDEFTIVGMEYVGGNPEDVVALWEDFVYRIDELPDVTMEDAGYGVILGFDPMNGEFDYMAAVGCDIEQSEVPEGMRKVSVPGGTYAVFAFPFDLLDQAWDYVYGDWLPGSGYVHGEGYDFEYYPAEFTPEGETMMMQLFVSVESE